MRLRAVQVVPEFRAAIVAHLVEISPTLQSAAGEGTGRRSACRFSGTRRSPTCRQDPAIIFANEFFDALPVNQAIKTERGWHERRIQIDANGGTCFHDRA